MIRTYHRTADGQQVGERDAFDERGVLRAGFKMRCPVELMDGVPVAAVADEQRRENVARYNARIGDAWRSPPPVDAAETRARDALPAAAADPYQRYDRRLQDAWRS